MKDIDFDELDKAVSSVISQSAAPVAEQPDTTAAAAPAPTPAVVTSAVPVTTATAPVTLSTTPPEPSQPPLAAKRRGRFMDVVPPQPSAKDQPATSVRPRVLTPLNPNPTATASPETPVDTAQPPAPTPTRGFHFDEENTRTLTSDAPHTPEPVAEPAPVPDAAAHVQPAPVQTPSEPFFEAEPEPGETEEKLPDSFTEPEPAKTDIIDQPEVDASPATDPDDPVPDDKEIEPVAETPTPEQPVQTPFLSDAKVEKRPLGSFGGADTGTHAASPAVLADPHPSVDPAHTLPEHTKTTESVAAHPVFDASTFHEPMAAVGAQKKRSGMLWWAIGLTVCLLVGVTAGYLLFTAGF